MHGLKLNYLIRGGLEKGFSGGEIGKAGSGSSGEIISFFICYVLLVHRKCNQDGIKVVCQITISSHLDTSRANPFKCYKSSLSLE